MRWEWGGSSPGLPIGDILPDHARHYSGTSVGGREPASALCPIAAIVVNDFPVDVSRTSSHLMRLGINKIFSSSLFLTGGVKNA